MEIYEKECSYCKEKKWGCFFHKNKSQHDGLNRRCKECVKKTHRESEIERLRKYNPERNISWNYR